MIRLNKYIAECGYASRRKADEFIEQARVQVNKKIVLDFSFKVNTEKDIVTVDGEKLKYQDKLYFLLNKPKGVITTTNDEKNRKTVVDLIKTNKKIFPVGRLDYNTTGVLILTNDGEFSNFITHPKNKIEREYLVTLDKPIEENDKIKLLQGIFLDGRKSKFLTLEAADKGAYRKVFVTTVEGRNHFVKRMFSALDYSVKNLHRSRFDNIIVKDLEPGEYVKLRKEDLKFK